MSLILKNDQLHGFVCYKFQWILLCCHIMSFIFIFLSYLFIENSLVSVQLPVLVNRGWVPRSWRNKASEDPQDMEKSYSVASQEIEEKERSFWWRLWPRKPKAIKVICSQFVDYFDCSTFHSLVLANVLVRWDYLDVL